MRFLLLLLLATPVLAQPADLPRLGDTNPDAQVAYLLSHAEDRFAALRGDSPDPNVWFSHARFTPWGIGIIEERGADISTHLLRLNADEYTSLDDLSMIHTIVSEALPSALSRWKYVSGEPQPGVLMQQWSECSDSDDGRTVTLFFARENLPADVAPHIALYVSNQGGAFCRPDDFPSAQ